MVAAKQPSATSATNQDIPMRKFQPSLVDWDEIKERVLAGEGYTSVAKDYEVSRQAIQKRCNKEEWIANKPRSMAVKRELFKRNQKAQPIRTYL